MRLDEGFLTLGDAVGDMAIHKVWEVRRSWFSFGGGEINS